MNTVGGICGDESAEGLQAMTFEIGPDGLQMDKPHHLESVVLRISANISGVIIRAMPPYAQPSDFLGAFWKL